MYHSGEFTTEDMVFIEAVECEYTSQLNELSPDDRRIIGNLRQITIFELKDKSYSDIEIRWELAHVNFIRSCCLKGRFHDLVVNHLYLYLKTLPFPESTVEREEIRKEFIKGFEMLLSQFQNELLIDPESVHTKILEIYMISEEPIWTSDILRRIIELEKYLQ
jgi:hypothetical protein